MSTIIDALESEATDALAKASACLEQSGWTKGANADLLVKQAQAAALIALVEELGAIRLQLAERSR